MSAGRCRSVVRPWSHSRPRSSPSRSGGFRCRASGARALLLVGAAVALTLWIGVTMGWSIVGDRSWDAFNKAVAYCAFLGLGVVLAAVGRRFGARLAAAMLSLVVGATLV